MDHSEREDWLLLGELVRILSVKTVRQTSWIRFRTRQYLLAHKTGRFPYSSSLLLRALTMLQMDVLWQEACSTFKSSYLRTQRKEGPLTFPPWYSREVLQLDQPGSYVHPLYQSLVEARMVRPRSCADYCGEGCPVLWLEPIIIRRWVRSSSPKEVELILAEGGTEATEIKEETSTVAEPQIKAHLMRAPREDQVRMIGLRSEKAGAADVSVSMMLSPLFPWNPQQETFSEENILFQWLCISQWRPGYPVGTKNLQISALYMKIYHSVRAHVQCRLHLSNTVLTETTVAEQPSSESGGHVSI